MSFVPAPKLPASALDPQRYATPAQRAGLLRRDGFVCVYCLDVGGDLTIDHVKAWSKGGRTHESNLVVCCAECNRTKNDWSLHLFAMRLEEEGRGLAATILRRVYARVSSPIPE